MKRNPKFFSSGLDIFSSSIKFPLEHRFAPNHRRDRSARWVRIIIIAFNPHTKDIKLLTIILLPSGPQSPRTILRMFRLQLFHPHQAGILRRAHNQAPPRPQSHSLLTRYHWHAGIAPPPGFWCKSVLFAIFQINKREGIDNVIFPNGNMVTKVLVFYRTVL